MGKGGTDPSTSVIQPSLPSLPNQSQLNSLAQWRLYAATPYVSSPWRSVDYFSQYQSPTQYMPQFTPGQTASNGVNLGPSVQNSGVQQPQGGVGGGPLLPGLGALMPWWQHGSMDVPQPGVVQGMQQNVSPSLAGLVSVLAGGQWPGLAAPPRAQQPQGGTPTQPPQPAASAPQPQLTPAGVPQNG